MSFKTQRMRYKNDLRAPSDALTDLVIGSEYRKEQQCGCGDAQSHADCNEDGRGLDFGLLCDIVVEERADSRRCCVGHR